MIALDARPSRSRRILAVVSAIHAEYDAPLATIQRDVLELLDDLTREELQAA
jgi:Coenzyme PQQ synthesis protein D (PqqD)